jgi:hypothetical protein
MPTVGYDFTKKILEMLKSHFGDLAEQLLDNEVREKEPYQGDLSGSE